MRASDHQREPSFYTPLFWISYEQDLALKKPQPFDMIPLLPDAALTQTAYLKWVVEQQQPKAKAKKPVAATRQSESMTWEEYVILQKRRKVADKLFTFTHHDVLACHQDDETKSHNLKDFDWYGEPDSADDQEMAPPEEW